MFEFGGLTECLRTCDRSGFENFSGRSVVSFGRYVRGEARIGYVPWHNDPQVERDKLSRLSGFSIVLAENNRNIYK
jgi:hypothetical protein